MTTTEEMKERLHFAASRLGELCDRMVFVGGAVRGLLITDPAVEGPRPTDDVDVIVEVASHVAYQKLAAELRDRGFCEDTRKGAPMCRYRHGPLILDVMPTHVALGSSNRWYPHALTTAQIVPITSVEGTGTELSIRRQRGRLRPQAPRERKARRGDGAADEPRSNGGNDGRWTRRADRGWRRCSAPAELQCDDC